MKAFVLLVVAAGFVFGAPSVGLGAEAIAVEHPVAEASFPFFCSWGYDWEERCHWDTWSPRLSIGGDRERIWRAGMRFPLRSVPAGAAILQAELFLYYDRMCVGPGSLPRPCDGRPWELEVVPILGTWFDEREPRLGFPVAWQWLAADAPEGWLTWDVTDLVAEWLDGAFENDGLLVKLVDAQEAHGGSGPRPPGRLFPDARLRPRLEIAYLPPP